jgi:shikimate kinase
MRIILIGMKGCGKTTIGTLLATNLSVPFIDCDTEIEKAYEQEYGEILPFRQIFVRCGKEYFHTLEVKALKNIVRRGKEADFIFSCGGSTPLYQENREILLGLGKSIFLNVEKGILLKRILAQGVPAFFPYQDDAQRSLEILLEERLPIYQQLADITLNIAEETPERVVSAILEKVRNYGAD